MKKIYTLVILASLTGSVFAQNDIIYFDFQNKINGSDLELGAEETLLDNRPIKITRFDYYLSNISLLKGAALTEEAIPDSYMLMTENDITNFNNDAFGGLDLTDVYGIRLHVGIDEATNHSDPSLQNQGHPLALKTPTMHWGWSGGYRFIVVNADVDANMNGTADEMLEFEAVSDNYYSSFDLMFDTPHASGDIAMNINVNLEKLLEDIDLSENGVLIQHGTGPGLQQMVTNSVSNDVFSLDQSSLDLNEFTGESVFVGPNPCEDILRICSSEALESVKLINSLGQVVLAESLNSEVTEISIGEIPSGMYYVLTKNTKGNFNTRLISKN